MISKHTIKMMKSRPCNPTTVVPCRVVTEDGAYTTWYPDGTVQTVHKNGNIEDWPPVMYVEKAYMHQSVLPTGRLHTYYYTEEESKTPMGGRLVDWHYIDLPDDTTGICWDNECSCYPSACTIENKHAGDHERCKMCADEYYDICAQGETKSRCEVIGKHVGDAEMCEYCAEMMDDDEDY